MVHNKKNKKTAKATQNNRHIQNKTTLKKKGYQVSITNKQMRCSIYSMMN